MSGLLHAAFEAVTSVLRANPPVREGMGRLLNSPALHLPENLREITRQIDYEADVVRLANWLEKVLVTEPPETTIRAFWFGLYEATAEDGAQTCVLYLSGSPVFDPVDHDWRCWTDNSYIPKGRYADSQALRDLRQVAGQGDDVVRWIGTYALCMGYAGLAVTELCRALSRELFLGECRERAVAVGWDDGDYIPLDSIRIETDPSQLRLW